MKIINSDDETCFSSPNGFHRKVKLHKCVYCDKKMEIISCKVWRLVNARKWVIKK